MNTTNYMNRFVIRYRPDKHEGQENKSGKEFFYWLKLDGDYFTNAGASPLALSPTTKTPTASKAFAGTMCFP